MLQRSPRQMNPDIIEPIEGAVIQHGEMNDRIYLMKLLPEGDPHEVIEQLGTLAEKKGYGKIFAKVPGKKLEAFKRDGFSVEAQIPGFYRGEEKAYFLGKFLDEQRQCLENEKLLEKVIETCSQKAPVHGAKLEKGLEVVELSPDDAEDMAKIYHKIFPTYPFPIDDPAYLREVLVDFVRSFGVRTSAGQLVALGACEMDRTGGNVEMTDFATLEDYRGKNLAQALLARMEEAMSEEGMATAYTIARAESFGMNATFAKGGYGFGGTLKNNTNISGSIESMNVWHKPLGKKSI